MTGRSFDLWKEKRMRWVQEPLVSELRGNVIKGEVGRGA